MLSTAAFEKFEEQGKGCLAVAETLQYVVYLSRHQCLDFNLPSSCPTITFVLQKLARMLTMIVIECSRQLMCTRQPFPIASRQVCQVLLYHIVAMYAAFGDLKGDEVMHSIVTIRLCPKRLQLPIRAAFGMYLYSHLLERADLQSSHDRSRSVHQAQA